MTHGATEFRESRYSAHYHANLIIIFQIKHTAASISIFSGQSVTRCHRKTPQAIVNGTDGTINGTDKDNSFGVMGETRNELSLYYVQIWKVMVSSRRFLLPRRR